MKKVFVGVFAGAIVALSSSLAMAYTDNFSFYFSCYNDGNYYDTSRVNELLSSESQYETSSLGCDSVCLNVFDLDGDATNESDGLSDMVLRRYSGDLDISDGDFTVLSNYGDPNTETGCGSYHATIYCWTTDWTDNYSFVYLNATTHEIRKTEVTFTDDHGATHVVTAIPSSGPITCIE
jgi:hypothetical protein